MIGRLKSAIPLGDIAIGARFLWSLPGFLRNPIGVEQARAILRRRLERREPDFLALLRRVVYQHAASPYRQLLKLAGCEYGDLERLVRQEGVEGALSALYRRGVYLTGDEFKGRRPAVRGSSVVLANPARLRNPRSAGHLPIQSSGSRGVPASVSLGLTGVRERALSRCLTLDARRGADWLHALWSVPGGTAMVDLLQYCAVGASPIRWFSHIDPAAPDLHPRYRWSGRALGWGGRAAGVRIARPEYVPLEDPLPIAQWMAAILREGRTPHLDTFASSAVRLCQAAFEAGIDLRGVQFTVGSEPITATRLALLRRSGAEVVPRYASIECGAIGWGCLAPEFADDLHLLHDRIALIQPGADEAVRRLPASALVISSLSPTAAVILLNVSLGDQAELSQRACGCPLERLGWATHLHTIRSFEKLTAGGMTFLDTDVIRVLEETLPTRFGGGPTDYQLVEEEAEDGRPDLRLVVHPAVGPLDHQAVADAFLTAISGGSGAERVMGQVWRDGQLLRIERAPPYATTSGKILHLHQRPARRSQPLTR